MTRTFAPQALGRTGLLVTPLCVGTSPLSMPELYGYRVEPTRAVATVLADLDSRINFLDTSNGYGDGASERRIGEAIRSRGGLPDGFVLTTKVDPDPHTGDFSGRRARISVEESLERLGLDHLEANPVFFVSDGADAIRALRERYFPDAIELLDWYHFVEQLRHAIGVAYPGAPRPACPPARRRGSRAAACTRRRHRLCHRQPPGDRALPERPARVLRPDGEGSRLRRRPALQARRKSWFGRGVSTLLQLRLLRLNGS